ncbi:MAG: OmpA family protein [Flavobacteriia bacterium]|nr:OmpA family protein [Flavobacteriia bacterium]
MYRIFLILIIFCSCAQLVSAQETYIVSFFFNVNESQPTVKSLKDLDTFNLFIEKTPIIILELNSYSSKDGSTDINLQIAEHRLNTIKAFLNPNAPIITANIRGTNYPSFLLYPISEYDKWRRVDVIYRETVKDTTSETFEKEVFTPEKDTIQSEIEKFIYDIDTLTEESSTSIYDKKLEKGDVFQMELNISFFDGAAKLTPSSFDEIDKLASYMNSNTNVYAFIRGHVCCGKAMKLSKQRAKIVAKELVKRGVNKKRLKAQGFSNNLPVVMPEKTEADRRRNRRVDVIFSVR